MPLFRAMIFEGGILSLTIASLFGLISTLLKWDVLGIICCTFLFPFLLRFFIWFHSEIAVFFWSVQKEFRDVHDPVESLSIMLSRHSFPFRVATDETELKPADKHSNISFDSIMFLEEGGIEIRIASFFRRSLQAPTVVIFINPYKRDTKDRIDRLMRLIDTELDPDGTKAVAIR
jgi:hypothetical protein